MKPADNKINPFKQNKIPSNKMSSRWKKLITDSENDTPDHTRSDHTRSDHTRSDHTLSDGGGGIFSNNNRIQVRSPTSSRFLAYTKSKVLPEPKEFNIKEMSEDFPALGN